MLKKEITYKDFNKNEVTRTFYFNLTKAEWLELEVQAKGLQNMMQISVETRDVETMHNTIRNFVLAGYGVREGDDFIKTEDLRQRFKATDAYSVLFMGLLEDDAEAINFIRAMLPQDMLQDIPNLEKKTSPIPPPPLPPATVAAGQAIIDAAGV